MGVSGYWEAERALSASPADLRSSVMLCGMLAMYYADCTSGFTLSMSLSCWIRSAFVKGWKAASGSSSDGEDIVRICCLWASLKRRE
jgi:hypothetical protein